MSRAAGLPSDNRPVRTGVTEQAEASEEDGRCRLGLAARWELVV
jgi:hypothetical protein